ncbi:hypothetical protein [Pyxidicoccus sp. MSG2]|uniref:hypothetical protein n=1 Tax=Pyxidicoccus sp. MSG2 TaxID=2996790 RepID=UPI00226EA2EE|nr:hypothetical protein [Pyxidicoccus sp. MSG2]MCY1015713.1 hypothetical protein [Pyxidicoccus sp. MSG2]
MPIRPDPAKNNEKTVFCINCPGVILNLANCRFTIEPDEGYEEDLPLPFFAASCMKCGYTELYRDGYLFQSNRPAEKTR